MHGLKKHTDEKGLRFLSSPFSVEAVSYDPRRRRAGKSRLEK